MFTQVATCLSLYLWYTLLVVPGFALYMLAANVLLPYWRSTSGAGQEQVGGRGGGGGRWGRREAEEGGRERGREVGGTEGGREVAQRHRRRGAGGAAATTYELAAWMLA